MASPMPRLAPEMKSVLSASGLSMPRIMTATRCARTCLVRAAGRSDPLTMWAFRQRPARGTGVGLLGAGRILTGLAAGLALMAGGFVGLRGEILSQDGTSGLVGSGARPEVIPGIQVGAFSGGASPGAVAGPGRASATAPVSPSASTTPLPIPRGGGVTVAGPAFEVVAG